MQAVLLLLFLADPPAFARELERADALAAAARAETEEARRTPAVQAALDAYAALLATRPKDPKAVPRLRRRRATLLAAVGRGADALAEQDALLAGPSARYDRARALLEGARLLGKAGDVHAAEKRCARAVEEYGDEVSIAAQALLERGRCLKRLARPKEAEAAWRRITERFRDEVKAAVDAFDELAILEIEAGRRDKARGWLKACAAEYEKRAARGDRYGAMLSRLLGEMKAPAMLQRAEERRG